MGYRAASVSANRTALPKVGYVQAWDRCAPPNPGGSMGLWTWEVVRRLARSCDVLVCAPLLNDDTAFEECEGVHFVRFPLTADEYLFRAAQRLKRSNNPGRPGFASHFYRGVYAVRAAWALRSHGCEVIHILNLPQFIPIMRRANPHSRIILHMECDWLAGLDRNLIDSHLEAADVIVGCSDYITDAIRRRFPHYAERCMTIYNGVDTCAFTPDSRVGRADGGEKVIFVNRISPEKGLHVLLDAFERVVVRRPKATLEIVGPDSVIPLESVTSLNDNLAVCRLKLFYQDNYPEQMRGRVRGVLEGRVTFVGPLLHSQLIGRMRQADILVQPSVFDEPFGIPIAEAMASGLPVVGSAAGGIPELIADGQTGILVDRDNPMALADALLRLLDNPALASEMGHTGRLRAEEKFSWEQIIDELKLCYFEPHGAPEYRGG
jgi:glycosyltransferase involved in cell wall biosynthesis